MVPRATDNSSQSFVCPPTGGWGQEEESPWMWLISMTKPLGISKSTVLASLPLSAIVCTPSGVHLCVQAHT